MTFDFPLKFSSSRYSELINKIFRHIHPVDYLKWEKLRIMSLLEFTYLAAGFEPSHVGTLDSLINELKETLHNLDSNELRSNALRLDHSVVEQFAKFDRIYAGRDGLDVIDKILNNANRLLSYAEIISREAMLINENERQLHLKKSDTEAWRTGFLINWAQNIPNFEIPNEILAFDNDYNIENEALTKRLITLDKKVLFHEGWFNTNACRAPKLVALIDGYVKEELLVASNKNRTFSTKNIADHIRRDYEIIKAGKSIDVRIKALSEVASIKPTGYYFIKKR